MNHTIVGVIVASLLISGCGGKGGEGEGSSGGGETDETLGNSSAPGGSETGTGGETGSGGVEPTGGGSISITATEATVTGEAESSGSVTTGEPTSPVCASMCEHAARCGLAEDVEGCTVLCADKLEEALPGCAAASAAYLECTGGLTCEQLADSLEGGLSHPCNSEQFDRDAECNPPIDCDWGAGGDFEGKQCSLEIMCPGQAVLEMKCDTEVCVCLEGGREVGSCPAEDACLDIGQIQDKGPGCCGFPEVDE